MDNENVFQDNLIKTKEYYYDANDAVWINQNVIDIIKNNPSSPIEALMRKTINGYEFKYRGIPFSCIIM